MDKWINKWISEKVYELMDEWKLISNEGMNQWVNESINNQMTYLINKLKNEWVNKSIKEENVE